MKNILLILLLLIIIYKLLNVTHEYFSDELMDHAEIKKHITYGLKTIDAIFNKHNIEYIIAYGTLLGAVRHHDMIPWDDDADLMIHKKDYWKVLGLKNEFEKHNFVAVKLCQLMQKRGVLKNSTIAGAIKKRDGFIFILNPKITKL